MTVCYHLYLEDACREKVKKIMDLLAYLARNAFSVQLIVLCFGSLGCVKSDIWKGLRTFCQSKEDIKNVVKWCSMSCIIGENYV